MSIEITGVTIAHRKKTAAEWADSEYVLAEAEWGYETDTGKVKIGDGVTAWNDLDYFGGSSTAADTSFDPATLFDPSITDVQKMGDELKTKVDAALTKTLTPWQPEVIEGTGEPVNFTTVPELSLGGGYSQNESVFTFSPIEAAPDDFYVATWKANVENVPEKYSITYNKASTDPNASYGYGYYNGVIVGDLDPDNEIYPTVGFNYMGPDGNGPTLLLVDNYFGDSIVDPAKTAIGPDGYGVITAPLPGQGVDVTLAIDNSALSASIFYDGVLQGTVYLLEPLIPESIWVSAYGLVSGIGQTATVTLVDRVIEDYVPFTINGFSGGYVIDETKYPQNPEGKGYEIVGLAAPAYWDELGREVKNGDFIVFDNDGMPQEIGGGEPDLSEYTQRDEDETITGDWDFQGAMKVGDYTYNTIYGPLKAEKSALIDHPKLANPMPLSFGVIDDIGTPFNMNFANMAVAYDIDDLSPGDDIRILLYGEDSSKTGGQASVQVRTFKDLSGKITKSIEFYLDTGHEIRALKLSSSSDGTYGLDLPTPTNLIGDIDGRHIKAYESGSTSVADALDSKVDKEDGKGLIEPAPTDGKTYARKDGAWVEVAGGGQHGGGTGDVEDAPSDGKAYVRKNGAWVEVVDNPQIIKTVIGEATLNGTTDNTVHLTDIVTTLGLEVGDVIRIQYSGYDKLHTVESITDDNSIIVNYEHAGNRGDGSLKLADETVSVTVTRITKWYNASVGLGQAWVDVRSFRADITDYINTTNRVIALGLGAAGRDCNSKIWVDGVLMQWDTDTFNNATLTHSTAFSIIPAGSTYRADTRKFDNDNGMNIWAELR